MHKYKDKGGGGGEIRTHGRVTPTTIFKTVAFNRSATPPGTSENSRLEALTLLQGKTLSAIITKTSFDFLARIFLNKAIV